MFTRHVTPRRSRPERVRPLLALIAALLAAATFGLRPSTAQGSGDAPTGVLTTPVSGPITTFPALQGTAQDANGGLALVKVLIARDTVTPGATDRIDFWNGTGWVFAVNITDGTVPSGDQLRSILTQHVTELPSVPVSGTSASWSYTTVPADANLTNGKYFVAAGVLDQAFQVGLVVPKAGGLFVTLVKGSTEPVDTTPPSGTLLPATGTYAAFPTVGGRAYDAGGLDHALIGLLRKLVGPTTTQYQYWTGSAFVTAKTLPNGTELTPAQIGAIATSVLASLPRVPLTGTGMPTPVAWRYTSLPHDAGVYYLAAVLFDKHGNFRPLPGAPGYYNTITVHPVTGITISGRVTRPDGTATVGVGNVPVLLIPGDSLGAAFLSLTNGALHRTLTSSVAIGDRPIGSFSFSDVPPGGYVLLPAVQKSLPAVQGLYFDPRFRTLTVGTVNIPGLNFSVAGTDSINPVVTIEHPVAGTTASSIGACDGSVRDAGGSGLFRMGMVISEVSDNGALIGLLYNWRTGLFVPTSAANADVVKLFSATPNADGSGHWSQSLPNLPTGHYQVSVIAVDNALNFSERANRDFNIVRK